MAIANGVSRLPTSFSPENALNSTESRHGRLPEQLSAMTLTIRNERIDDVQGPGPIYGVYPLANAAK